MCPEGEVKLRKKAKLAAMRGGASPSSTASLSPSKAQRDLVMGQEMEPEAALSLFADAREADFSAITVGDS